MADVPVGAYLRWDVPDGAAAAGQEVLVPEDDWRVNFARPHGCTCEERQTLPATSAEAEI